MKILKVLLSYPMSIIFYLVFGLLIMLLHVVQVLTLNIWGYQAHKASVDFLNIWLLTSLKILGTRIKFINNQNLPKNVPLIFACNHQSIYDISPILHYLSKYHPKFVAKKELGKGLPGISYYLRNGGSVLIDRSKTKESLKKLMEFGKYIENNKQSAVIFPEGTRSKDGIPKRFSENGLKMIMRNAPSSYVVPITVNNSWKLSSVGSFPMEIGVKIEFEVHPPIKADSMPFEQLFEQVESQIKSSIKTID